MGTIGRKRKSPSREHHEDRWVTQELTTSDGDIKLLPSASVAGGGGANGETGATIVAGACK